MTKEDIIIGPPDMKHALDVAKRTCKAPSRALPIQLKQTDVLLRGLAECLPAYRADDKSLIAANLCATCWNVKCVAGLPFPICSYCATS